MVVMQAKDGYCLHRTTQFDYKAYIMVYSEDMLSRHIDRYDYMSLYMCQIHAIIQRGILYNQQ